MQTTLQRSRALKELGSHFWLDDLFTSPERRENMGFSLPFNFLSKRAATSSITSAHHRVWTGHASTEEFSGDWVKNIIFLGKSNAGLLKV